ncbi:MAG: NUDIX domain-containing protein [Nitrospirota bacterium]
MEYFDILDGTGEKTGGRISRDEAHRLGIWHRAFHCLITYERNGRRVVLFQKRSLNKKIAPGKFDVSVGGHIASGEDTRSAGLREIAEELGLTVRFENLVSVGCRIFVYCFTPEIKEYEFQDIFLLPLHDQPSTITIQEEELDGLLEMDIQEGIALFSGETQSIVGSFLNPGASCPEELPVVAQDFVPCLDNYYFKMLLLAQRYHSGERKYLVI